MKKLSILTLTLILGLSYLGNTIAVAQQQPYNNKKAVKVACVGNSITWGWGNEHPDSYPAQLQALLGEGYSVKNFGVSGLTLMSKGDKPYVKSDYYRASLDFQPDIVLIKLGTNDSKPQNRIYLTEDYKADYTRLIESYRSLRSQPRVIVMTPVRCYTDGGISGAVIAKWIVPYVWEVAEENGVEIIDLYELFPEEYDAGLMPDRVHPSVEGAGMMAKKISEYLLRNETDEEEAL